jgi:O-antigen ligase
VRDELHLAQAEIRQSLKHAGIGAGLFSVAGLLSAFGVGALVAATVAGLAVALPVWLSALIVGVALLVAAAVVGLVGRGQVRDATPLPEQTVANVKEDIREVKDASHVHT